MARNRATNSAAEPAPMDMAMAIKDFAELHGGAEAVVEYLGKRGVRIALVGNDDSLGELLAPSTDVAREACERVSPSITDGTGNWPTSPGRKWISGDPEPAVSCPADGDDRC